MALRGRENGTHPGVGILRTEQCKLGRLDGHRKPFHIAGVDVEPRFVRVPHHPADARRIHQLSVRHLHGVHRGDRAPCRQQGHHVRECLPRVRSDNVPLIDSPVGKQTASGVGNPRHPDVHPHEHPAVKKTEGVPKCCPFASM